MPLPVDPALHTVWQAGPGQIVEHAQPVGHEARVVPRQKGDDVVSARIWGRK